jgi:hypothetical protein
MPGGQYLNHFNAVRYRILGNGTLHHQINSLDNVYIKTLPNLTLQSSTNRYPNLLTNVTEQRIQLELWTDEIDEVFTVSQIIIYSRPITTGYPQ